MRRRRLLVMIAFAVSGVVACSFELADVVPGDGPDGSSPDGAPIGDAGPDIILAPPSACAADACFALPSGWNVLGFNAAGSSKICPTGFDETPTSTFEDPSTTGTPCTCGCNITNPPTCVNGSIPYTYDTNGTQTCTMTLGLPITVKDAGGCESIITFPVTNNTDVKYTPPLPDGGTCTAQVVDQSVVKYGRSGSRCAPQESALVRCSDGRACAPAASADVAVCIAQSGDVACPPGAFSTKHTVGPKATLTCAGATCACAVTATCAGSFKFFKNNDCTGGNYTAIVDGVCRNEGAGSGTYSSFQYTGTTSNIGCSMEGGAGTPTVTMDTPTTVCCRP